jgi:hypothetical protein
MSRQLLLKNSGANVARILAASLIALVLPPLLVRTLPRETYSTWVLILQLSAYANFFDFGVQTALGRFVARTDELQDFESRDQIVTTSFVILVGGALLSLLLIAGLAWQFPFHLSCENCTQEIASNLRTSIENTISSPTRMNIVYRCSALVNFATQNIISFRQSSQRIPPYTAVMPRIKNTILDKFSAIPD